MVKKIVFLIEEELEARWNDYPSDDDLKTMKLIMNLTDLVKKEMLQLYQEMTLGLLLTAITNKPKRQNCKLVQDKV